MEEIQSDRGVVYVKDGFVYHCNAVRPGSRYLKCPIQSCKSRAILKQNVAMVRSSHNHPPDELARETLLLKNALKWASMRDAERKSKDIYDDVCKLYPNAAVRLGYKKVKTLIYRYREMGGYVADRMNFFKHIDEARDTSEPDADNDGAAQGNPSSMPGPSTSGQESEKGLEAEVPEGSGASSIESVPCASTSNIQFVASEITSMQDPEFGTLEKSGMSQTVLTPPPPPLKEGTSTQSQDVACGEEKEKQASLEESINIPSVDTTQKIPTSTVVNAEVAESIYPCRPKTSNILEESESDRLLRSMISAKKLDTVVERLEAVSNKLTLNTLSDQYDHFGKYIGSVLRGLPLKKVNSLKKKILSDIEAVMEEKESYLKSIGTQVGLDVLASEKSFKKYLKEKSQAKTVPADSKSLASNTPILGGNMPLLFPGASTSSFKLLPVIPMSATTSMVSSATLVTTPSLVSSVTSVHNVPVSTCETVTTVAKSADGTLLAVTIPKPKMCEAIVGPGQSLLIPPRGQKRKQTTAAYIIKKVPAPTSCETATLPTRITTSCVTATLPTRMTTSCETTTLPTRIITPCETTTLPTRMTTSCETTTLPTRMTTPGDAFSLNKQTISYSESGTQTGGDLQLQEDSRDSGGGDMSFIVPQPLKNEEQEFEMDFEEGNELAQIKQDQDFFETVLCGESSSMYIKEETPDLEEPSEGDLGAPPLPPVTISTPLICPICNTQCNNGDELARHHFSTHPGCVPPLFILPQGGAIS